ncbi:hypothetical protein K493DRAFT_340407 [Basidiobolus meristosporus CBS 931.73]|uniref:t-SNARE coiled-coil homology domain-containing protein n=1 Tax=Basidiobolus meristosporus CBS 931.73 TaxID=1314790 RepID=A0A1Y1XVM7_9FUNG|nr:hypothetical protein K493DRAFT_340407 [Basidiobolus meristosporus CBS 931.73]|eukprot:ORX89773.1 hypothetical protein K493DRAFT_340407 [Basidiobolus meristosporus CBS 931.73]
MEGKSTAKLNALAENTLMLIHERNRNQNLGLNYQQQEQTIRKNLERLKEGIVQLEQELSQDEEAGVSSLVLKQKEDKVIKLSEQHERLEALLSGDRSERARDLLLGSRPSKISKWETSVQIDDGLENGPMLQLQERILDEQDRSLDQLSEAVGRQRELGLLITDELDRHIELLDETDQAIDSSQRRLNSARKRLDYFRRKSREAGKYVYLAIYILNEYIERHLYRVYMYYFSSTLTPTNDYLNREIVSVNEYKVDQAAAGDIEDATQKEVEKLKDEYMAISKDLREKMESLESRLSQEKVDKDVDNLRETRDKLRDEAYAKSRKLKLILDRCYQLRFISSSVLAASESK